MTQSRPLTDQSADEQLSGATSASATRVAPVDPNAAVTKAFSASVMVSAVRCLLTYILFPWVLPLLGVARGVGPVVGLTVGFVAIGFNIASIRRFMRSGHRFRYWISSLNVMVIGLLVVLIARDLSELFS